MRFWRLTAYTFCEWNNITSQTLLFINHQSHLQLLEQAILA